MISSFGKQPIREFPKFTYDPSSQQPFPYVSITSTDPFLIFDGELLKERNLFIHHGYKSIDGKTLTADETVIGMWWPPKFRPFLIEWMNNLESTTREAIIGKRSPEEFFFTTL